MLLIPTAVTIDSATPERKIPKCTHPTFPEEKTIAAAPAGGWMIPSLAMPGITMAGANADRNHGGRCGVPGLARGGGREVVLQRGEGAQRGEDEAQIPVRFGRDEQVHPGQQRVRDQYPYERPHALLEAEARRHARAAAPDLHRPPREPALRPRLRPVAELLGAQADAVRRFANRAEVEIEDGGTPEHGRPVRRRPRVGLLFLLRLPQRPPESNYCQELDLHSVPILISDIVPEGLDLFRGALDGGGTADHLGGAVHEP